MDFHSNTCKVVNAAQTDSTAKANIAVKLVLMSREAIEVGASTWSRIQRLYEPDATAHRERCESEGLQRPQEVFAQLVHEQSNNEVFAVIVRSIDYYSAFGLASICYTDVATESKGPSPKIP